MSIKKKCKQIRNSADKVREQHRIPLNSSKYMKTIARPVSIGDYNARVPLACAILSRFVYFYGHSQVHLVTDDFLSKFSIICGVNEIRWPNSRVRLL